MNTEEQIHGTGKWLIFNKDYIAEFVYGGIDGAITTFAVVAGAAGAGAGIEWVIIFGVANLIADGFSMSVGNYFSTKSERERFEKHKAVEYWEVDNLREKEIEEIREIYEKKGFKGELLEQVVEVIISDKDIWVDTMMKEELEMTKDGRLPIYTATATFGSFILIGSIPLLSYIIAIIADLPQDKLFIISCIATALALILIGFMKAMVNERSWVKGVLETLLLGGLAALLAYFAGEWLGNTFL